MSDERWELVVTSAGEIVGYVAGDSRILRSARMDAREVPVVPEQRALDAEAEVERLRLLDEAQEWERAELWREKANALAAEVEALRRDPCGSLHSDKAEIRALRAERDALRAAIEEHRAQVVMGARTGGDLNAADEALWEALSAVRAETEGE